MPKTGMCAASPGIKLHPTGEMAQLQYQGNINIGRQLSGGKVLHYMHSTSGH